MSTHSELEPRTVRGATLQHLGNATLFSCLFVARILRAGASCRCWVAGWPTGHLSRLLWFAAPTTQTQSVRANRLLLHDRDQVQAAASQRPTPTKHIGVLLAKVISRLMGAHVPHAKRLLGVCCTAAVDARRGPPHDGLSSALSEVRIEAAGSGAVIMRRLLFDAHNTTLVMLKARIRQVGPAPSACIDTSLPSFQTS